MLKTYTITPASLGLLAKLRSAQVATAKARNLRENGCALHETHPLAEIHVAHVEFVNGVTWRAAVRVSLLADWARSVNSQTLALSFPAPGQMLLRASNCSHSSLRVHTSETFTPATVKRWHTSNAEGLDVLGPPIRLVAPADGGAFEVQADTSALAEGATAARYAREAKKADTKARAEVKARQAERAAAEALAKEIKAHDDAQAVLASMTLADALHFARKVLHTRRQLRAALAAPAVVPAWFPETYVWQDWDNETQAHVSRTADTRKAHSRHVEDVGQACAAFHAFKPAMRRPKWGGTPSAILGPKYEGLKNAVGVAERALSGFIEDRHKAHCEANGVPPWTRYDLCGWGEGNELRAYSRSRLAVRKAGKLIDDAGKVWEAADAAHAEAVKNTPPLADPDLEAKAQAIAALRTGPEGKEGALAAFREWANEKPQGISDRVFARVNNLIRLARLAAIAAK